MPTRPMTAWLIKWDWMGDHAAVDEPYVDIVSSRRGGTQRPATAQERVAAAGGCLSTAHRGAWFGGSAARTRGERRHPSRHLDRRLRHGRSDRARAPRAPAAPTGLTATAGNGTVTLSWTAGNNGGSAVTGWKYIKHSNNAWDSDWTEVPNSGASTTSYTVSSLTNGTAYKFKVRAVNANGDGAESAESGEVTPSAKPAKPTGLTVTAGNGSATLSWTAGNNGGSAITGWKYIKHSNNSWDSGWTEVPNSGASTTSYTVPSLTNGTAYKFKVRAVNANGDGAESDESGAVTPSAPVSATLTASGVTATTATLAIANWSKAWSFKGDYVACTDVAAGTKEKSLSGLTPGRDYLVYAWGAHNCPVNDSTWPRARSVIFTTLLPKVEGVSVAAGGAALTVGWTAQSGVTGYHVQWKSESEDWSSDRQSDAATNSAAISNLTGGATYTVRVRSYHKGYKNRIKYGQWSEPATGAAEQLAVTLTASAVTHDSATLTIGNWNAGWHYKANAAPDASCSSSAPRGGFPDPARSSRGDRPFPSSGRTFACARHGNGAHPSPTGRIRPVPVPSSSP